MAKRKIEFPKRERRNLFADYVTSVVLLNQIRSIDKQYLVKRIGIVSDHLMGYVDNAIQISLGLIEL